MKILYLTLTTKWFYMILSGLKRNEYREFKTYWIRRLKKGKYDMIQFTNGGHFGRTLPWFLIELIDIKLHKGNPKYGAPHDKLVFDLELGKIFSAGNLKWSIQQFNEWIKIEVGDQRERTPEEDSAINKFVKSKSKTLVP